MTKKKQKSEGDHSPLCPLGSLSVLSRKISNLFRCHFSELNVTNSQVNIFLALHQKGEMTQKELGKTLELERSTVSRDLVRLLDQGHLYKAKGGKSPVIGLTAQGKDFAKEISVQWEKGYKESTDLLGEKGLAALRELEKQILSNK